MNRSGSNLGRTLLLALFFVLSFRTFQYFPGGSVLRELWIAWIFLFLLSAYLLASMRNGFRMLLLELYAVALIVIVPTTSAVMANIEFGQPLVYGVLAQRGVVLCGGVMLFYHYYRKGLFSLRDVERALVWLAWSTLLLYTFLQLAVDPNEYASYGRGLVSEGSRLKAAKFKFEPVFIIFGYFYYFFAGFRKKDTKSYLYALAFLLYLLFGDGGRSLLSAVAVSNLVFLVRWGSFSRLLLWAPRMLIITLVLFTGLLLAKQEYLYELGRNFEAAFSSVTTGELTSDSSANARVLATKAAMPYIKKHWLIGNGAVSYQWRGGYADIFGYFYTADIGIVGMLFLYGVGGTALFMLQFFFAKRYATWSHGWENEYSALVAGVKGFLLYYALHSLVTGAFAQSAEVGLLFIGILYAAARTGFSGDPSGHAVEAGA